MEILDWYIELWSRTQLFSREMLTDTSSLRGLISRSPAILLAVGIGGIHSVEKKKPCEGFLLFKIDLPQWPSS